MHKNKLENLLADLGKDGLTIGRNKVEIFIPDSANPGFADHRQTEHLKNKVFRRVPVGWSGFRRDNGGWVVSSRFSFQNPSH